MYGLISKMRCVPGRRADVIRLMNAEGAYDIAGCRSFIVAEDPADVDAVWITEVWETKEAHDASLQLPEVKASIAEAMPLIAGFEFNVKTKPVAGI